MASTDMIDIGSWLDADANTAPSTEQCGLFTKSDTPVPLRSRHVDATVYAEHGFCEVTETLAYIADEDVTAKFVFPLPPRSAIYRRGMMLENEKIFPGVNCHGGNQRISI